MEKIKILIYRYSVLFIAIIALVFTCLVANFKLLNTVMKDQNVLVTISTTLAGFLFTGQGILLTLSPENKFLKMASKYGYLNDFHHHCRWAEIPFIISVFFSLKIIAVQFINYIYLFLFIFAMFFAAWAFILFGYIVKYYSKLSG